MIKNSHYDTEASGEVALKLVTWCGRKWF